LANSTFRIVCGHSSGSGFSYRLENIIITNCHVIENTFITKQEIYAITEDNISFLAKLIAYSSKEEYDFAILEIQSSLPKNRNILQPNLELELKRGIKTVFSGFPHGIPDLLIHEAIISNVQNTKSFYLDGSINGANSGIEISPISFRAYQTFPALFPTIVLSMAIFINNSVTI
jgi:S1-C subfamily serine protease